MEIDLQTFRPLIEVALDRTAPEVDLDTHLYTDAGLDSMGAVALVVEIDRCFKVRLDEEEIPKLHTPRQYLEAIRRYLSQAAQPVPGESSSAVDIAAESAQ